jgi:hypothetical protein
MDTNVNTTTKAKQKREIAAKKFMTMKRQSILPPHTKLNSSKFWGNPEIKGKVTNDLFVTKPEEVTPLTMLRPHHPITDLKKTLVRITSTRSSRTTEILIGLAQEQQEMPHKDRSTGAQTDNVLNATILVGNTICKTITSGLQLSTYNDKKRAKKVPPCKKLHISALSVDVHNTDVTFGTTLLDQFELNHRNIDAKEICVKKSSYTAFNIGTALASTTSNTFSTWQLHLTNSKTTQVPSYNIPSHTDITNERRRTLPYYQQPWNTEVHRRESAPT